MKEYYKVVSKLGEVNHLRPDEYKTLIDTKEFYKTWNSGGLDCSISLKLDNILFISLIKEEIMYYGK
jgi:hypothetical protein